MKKFDRWGVMQSPVAPVVAVVLNVVLAYVVYFICRLEFLLENYSYFSGHVTAALWGGGLVFDTSAIAYTNVLWVAMVLLPLWIKETPAYHRVCKWVFVVVNSLALVINFCDSVYFPYTLRRTTSSVFREFGNENNLAGIFGHELLTHWYLVLVAALVVWAMCKLYVTPRLQASQMATRGQRVKYALVQLGALLVAAVLAVGGMRGGFSGAIRPITVSNANQYVQRPTDCALVLNTPFSLLRTLGKNTFEVPTYYATAEQAAQVYSPVHNQGGVQQAPMRKKNVVVLIVESFGREYIGALNKWYFDGKYEGYTPCVDSLIAQSAVWCYSYCNGRKSIDGMPSVLCGIPMFKEPFVLTPASMNNYTSLAGLLAGEGYSTAFFHGAMRGSMGFMAFANKVGFGQYYGREDYDADPRFGHGGDQDYDGNWGIWDEPFLQYWCAKIGEMREPFMTACFTVSSHNPFVVPEKYKDRFREEGLPIHKCIRYTDMAIGRFFREAAKQPWYRNTLFVITSDHTNQSDHAQYQTDLGGFCSPVIIFDPSGELVQPGLREAVAQQTDILPTVLGLLGYQKPFMAFGCDLMTTPAADTYAVNYLNGTYQYVKHGYVMQFDGQRVTGLYALTDLLMKRNLAGTVPEQAQMERELKAIIQQYMWRMVTDNLLPK